MQLMMRSRCCRSEKKKRETRRINKEAIRSRKECSTKSKT